MKYIYRLPPCPAYDIEGFESWLESLAREGLVLSDEGFALCFGVFRRTDPTPMRYRLQPRRRGLWAENAPDDAALELFQASGWTYMGDFGGFSIYAAGPEAREMDTEPQIQAMALRDCYRRFRRSVVWDTLWPLLLLALTFLAGPVRILAEPRAFLIYLLLLLDACSLTGLWSGVRGLRNLRRRMFMGEPPDRKKKWKAAHWRQWTALAMLLITAICWAGSQIAGSWKDRSAVPLEEYQEALPFGTIPDLIPGGNWEPLRAGSDTVAACSTAFAPVHLYLQQARTCAGPDGTAGGVLQVEYFELQTVWLARELVREIELADRLERRDGAVYQPPEAAQTLDYAAFYETGRMPLQTLLLRQDSRVCYVQFYLFDGSLPVGQWAETFIQCFQ